MTLLVTKHVITIMVRRHCYSVITVISASANSRGNWKQGLCYLSNGERPLVWQRNTLCWPIAYSPQAWLGNLYHSGQFVSFFFCNWSQYAKRTWGKTLPKLPSWTVVLSELEVSLCVKYGFGGWGTALVLLPCTWQNTYVILTMAHTRAGQHSL